MFDLEDRQHRRKRHTVQIIPEAQRHDAVDRHIDIVRGEIPQRCRENAHQPIEDDLQHRQAFVGHQAGADDALDAAGLLIACRPAFGAQQAIDLRLIEDLTFSGRILIVWLAPGIAHCTSNSVNRISFTLAGARTRLARAINSSRRRWVPALPRNSSGRISRR